MCRWRGYSKFPFRSVYRVVETHWDQTYIALQVFFLAMAMHPEVQKKAQEELDRVIGRDRMPTVDDEKNLPYCHVSN